MQGQVAQQIIELGLMAEQAQIGLRQGGLQQAPHHQFGQTI